MSNLLFDYDFLFFVQTFSPLQDTFSHILNVFEGKMIYSWGGDFQSMNRDPRVGLARSKNRLKSAKTTFFTFSPNFFTLMFEAHEMFIKLRVGSHSKNLKETQS